MSVMELQFERRVRQMVDMLVDQCDGLALGEVTSTDIRRTKHFIEVAASFSLPRAKARVLFYSPQEDLSEIRFVKCEIRMQPVPTMEDVVVFSQCYESAQHLFGSQGVRARRVLGVHQEGDFHEFTAHYSDFVSPFDEQYAPSETVNFRRAA